MYQTVFSSGRDYLHYISIIQRIIKTCRLSVWYRGIIVDYFGSFKPFYQSLIKTFYKIVHSDYLFHRKNPGMFLDLAT